MLTILNHRLEEYLVQPCDDMITANCIVELNAQTYTNLHKHSNDSKRSIALLFLQVEE